METPRQGRNEKFIEFVIKIAALLVVNIFAWKSLYQQHRTAKMWSLIIGSVIAAFLLSFFIHPMRRKRRAARRARMTTPTLFD